MTELKTVVVLDTGRERHYYETALGVWREDENRKHHSTVVRYEDPDSGAIETDRIYAGRILYCCPTYAAEEMPDVDELVDDTTSLDESYWGYE